MNEVGPDPHRSGPRALRDAATAGQPRATTVARVAHPKLEPHP
ncbi:hypothetical protein [Streptomyces sp. L7]